MLPLRKQRANGKDEDDTVMEIPIDAHIPKKYIPRETGRISMYKRIAAITDIDSFRDVQDELIDRYGEIPRYSRKICWILHCINPAQLSSVF